MNKNLLIVLLLIVLIVESVLFALYYKSNQKADINNGTESDTIFYTIQGFNDNSVIEGVKVGDYVKVEASPKQFTDSDYEWISEKSGFNEINKLVNDNTSSYKDSYPISYENIVWRVFSVNKKEVKLIAMRPTSAAVYLAGDSGYQNGMYILNEVCNKLYSSEVGTVQNISLNDIESKLTKQYKYKSLDENCFVDFSENNKVYCEMLLDDNEYWISEPYNNSSENNMNISKGLKIFNNGMIQNRTLLGTSQIQHYSASLRPVMTIDSNYVIAPCEGENSIENMHKIVKKEE
jgi:hypothetical protein